MTHVLIPFIASNRVRFVVPTYVVLAFSASLFAAEDEPTPKMSQSVIAATKHAATLEMALAEPKAGELLKLSERALLTFGDAARDHEAGTLWVWSSGGRPVAMMELFRATGDDKLWLHALTMTSPKLVRMKANSGAMWSPKKSDFAPKALPGELGVGDKPAMRLRQMKDLARRFTAHEFWDPNNSRFELRLLTQPVHRYVDVENNVLDGAVFVFAHGTNPEVLMLLEAVGADAATAQWQYSFARSGSAEMHVELDGKQVWLRERPPGITGTPNDSYWLFSARRDEE